MKILIYYFSGTGNNLWTAKKLSEQLKDTEILPIRCLQDHKEIEKSYTHVIFLVPSYYSHIPPFVGKCLEGVVFAEEQKVITIVDCGGNRGLATEDLRAAIAACGKKVDGEYMIMHPGSYILSYGAFPKFYQKITMTKAKKYINKIVGDIQTGQLETKSKPGFLYRDRYEERLQQAIASYTQIGLQYEVSDACVSCGTCEKVCPVHNIHLEQGKPVFNDQCQQCMACIQWCPQRAIDYKGKAAKRKRYHNEEITLQEFISAGKK